MPTTEEWTKPPPFQGVWSVTNNWSYLAFVNHPSVAPHLVGYELGASDDEARHWLILDREEPRQLYAALTPVAQRFLQEQWNHLPQQSEPFRVENVAALEQLAEALSSRSWTNVMVSSTDVMRALQQERQHTQELQAWLDAHPSPQIPDC